MDAEMATEDLDTLLGHRKGSEQQYVGFCTHQLRFAFARYFIGKS